MRSLASLLGLLLTACYASHAPPVAPRLTHHVLPSRDVNCDGYDDALVESVLDTSRLVHLYLGGPDGLAAQPAHTWSATLFMTPTSAAIAGDLDGDGCAEVAIGNHFDASSCCPGEACLADGRCAGGVVRIYAGAPAGPNDEPMARLLASDVPDIDPTSFGGALTAVGNLDGDGADELALLTRQHALVYHGTAPLTVLHTPPEHDEQYLTLDALGDVDGDGLADMGVAAIVPGGTRVHVLHGAPLRDDIVSVHAQIAWMGAADLDADGQLDLVAGGSDNTVTALLGPAPWSSHLSMRLPGQWCLDRNLAIGGGAVIGVSVGDDLGGRAWRLHASGPPELVWTDPDGAAGSFIDTMEVVAAGDVDADGRADLLVGATRHERAYLLLGGSDARVVTPPNGAGVGFGEVR